MSHCVQAGSSPGVHSSEKTLSNCLQVTRPVRAREKRAVYEQPIQGLKVICVSGDQPMSEQHSWNGQQKRPSTPCSQTWERMERTKLKRMEVKESDQMADGFKTGGAREEESCSLLHGCGPLENTWHSFPRKRLQCAIKQRLKCSARLFWSQEML